MARLESSRYTVFLCLLIALQEVGPAHYGVIEAAREFLARPETGPNYSVDNESEAVRTFEGMNTVAVKAGLEMEKWATDENASKRAGAGVVKLLSKLLKGLPLAGKVLNYGTTFAALVTSIHYAIQGCCSGVTAKACTYRDEFLKYNKSVHAKTKQGDDLALKGENLEVWVNSGVAKFDEIRQKMNRINDAQEAYIHSLNPRGMGIALNKATARAQKYIADMKRQAKEAEYLKVASMYNTAIKNAANIGVPLLGVSMPIAQTVYTHAKDYVKAKQTRRIEMQERTTLSNPRREQGQIRYRKGKFGRYRESLTRLNRFHTDAVSRREKMMKNGKKVLKGFTTAFNFGFAALNIYTVIDQIQNCVQIMEKAKEARDEMKKTDDALDKSLADITKSNDMIEKSFELLRGNLTVESFTMVVRSIKRMTQKIGRNGNAEMIGVTAKIRSFITGIKKDSITPEETYNLMQTLLEGLVKVPFSIRCYTGRNEEMQDVFAKCRTGEGVKTFDQLYTVFSNKAAQQCTAQIRAYITRDIVWRNWQAIARREKRNENCLINNKMLKSAVCRDKNDEYTKEQIAQRHNIDVATVETIMQGCPSRELSPREKRRVCQMKARGKSVADIAAKLKVDVSLVQAVVDSNCP